MQVAEVDKPEGGFDDLSPLDLPIAEGRHPVISSLCTSPTISPSSLAVNCNTSDVRVPTADFGTKDFDQYIYEESPQSSPNQPACQLSTLPCGDLECFGQPPTAEFHNLADHRDVWVKGQCLYDATRPGWHNYATDRSKYCRSEYCSGTRLHSTPPLTYSHSQHEYIYRAELPEDTDCVDQERPRRIALSDGISICSSSVPSFSGPSEPLSHRYNTSTAAGDDARIGLPSPHGAPDVQAHRTSLGDPDQLSDVRSFECLYDSPLSSCTRHSYRSDAPHHKRGSSYHGGGSSYAPHVASSAGGSGGSSPYRTYTSRVGLNGPSLQIAETQFANSGDYRPTDDRLMCPEMFQYNEGGEDEPFDQIVEQQAQQDPASPTSTLALGRSQVSRLSDPLVDTSGTQYISSAERRIGRTVTQGTAAVESMATIYALRDSDVDEETPGDHTGWSRKVSRVSRGNEGTSGGNTDKIGDIFVDNCARVANDVEDPSNAIVQLLMEDMITLGPKSASIRHYLPRIIQSPDGESSEDIRLMLLAEGVDPATVLHVVRALRLREYLSERLALNSSLLIKYCDIAASRMASSAKATFPRDEIQRNTATFGLSEKLPFTSSLIPSSDEPRSLIADSFSPSAVGNSFEINNIGEKGKRFDQSADEVHIPRPAECPVNNESSSASRTNRNAGNLLEAEATNGRSDTSGDRSEGFNLPNPNNDFLHVISRRRSSTWMSETDFIDHSAEILGTHDLGTHESLSPRNDVPAIFLSPSSVNEDLIIRLPHSSGAVSTPQAARTNVDGTPQSASHCSAVGLSTPSQSTGYFPDSETCGSPSVGIITGCNSLVSDFGTNTQAPYSDMNGVEPDFFPQPRSGDGTSDGRSLQSVVTGYDSCSPRNQNSAVPADTLQPEKPQPPNTEKTSIVQMPQLTDAKNTDLSDLEGSSDATAVPHLEVDTVGQKEKGVSQSDPNSTRKDHLPSASSKRTMPHNPGQPSTTPTSTLSPSTTPRPSTPRPAAVGGEGTLEGQRVVPSAVAMSDGVSPPSTSNGSIGQPLILRSAPHQMGNPNPRSRPPEHPPVSVRSAPSTGVPPTTETTWAATAGNSHNHPPQPGVKPHSLHGSDPARVRSVRDGLAPTRSTADRPRVLSAGGYEQSPQRDKGTYLHQSGRIRGTHSAVKQPSSPLNLRGQYEERCAAMPLAPVHVWSQPQLPTHGSLTAQPVNLYPPINNPIFHHPQLPSWCPTIGHRVQHIPAANQKITMRTTPPLGLHRLSSGGRSSHHQPSSLAGSSRRRTSRLFSHNQVSAAERVNQWGSQQRGMAAVFPMHNDQQQSAVLGGWPYNGCGPLRGSSGALPPGYPPRMVPTDDMVKEKESPVGDKNATRRHKTKSSRRRKSRHRESATPKFPIASDVTVVSLSRSLSPLCDASTIWGSTDRSTLRQVASERRHIKHRERATKKSLTMLPLPRREGKLSVTFAPDVKVPEVNFLKNTALDNMAPVGLPLRSTKSNSAGRAGLDIPIMPDEATRWRRHFFRAGSGELITQKHRSYTADSRRCACFVPLFRRVGSSWCRS